MLWYSTGGGADRGALQCLCIRGGAHFGVLIRWARACTNKYTKAKFTKLYTVQSRQVSYWLQEL